jgi:hypothetical protein
LAPEEKQGVQGVQEKTKFKVNAAVQMKKRINASASILNLYLLCFWCIAPIFEFLTGA